MSGGYAGWGRSGRVEWTTPPSTSRVPSALVFGNEAAGLPVDLVDKEIDGWVSIPMPAGPSRSTWAWLRPCCALNPLASAVLRPRRRARRRSRGAGRPTGHNDGPRARSRDICRGAGRGNEETTVRCAIRSARLGQNWQAGRQMNVVQDALERGKVLIGKAGSVAELRAVEPEAFGKRSDLAAITATLRDLSPPERREVGRAVQVARAHLEELFEQRSLELEAREARRRAESERLDLSEVAGLFAASAGPLAESLGQPLPRGHLHLVTQVRQELEDIFLSMGFEVAEGPEVEDDWHNFEALNMPPHHPAQGHVRHVLPECRSPRERPAPDPHFSSPGAPDGIAPASHLRRRPRPLLSPGHARCAPPACLSPGRGARGRRRHQHVSSGWSPGNIYQRLFRSWSSCAAAAQFLSFYGAIW